MPVTHIDWLADLKPYEKPSQEDITANRQSRLDQLDKIAAERAQQFDDSRYGMDWLNKRRGSGGKADFEWWANHLPSPSRKKTARVTIKIVAPVRVLKSLLAYLVKMNV